MKSQDIHKLKNRLLEIDPLDNYAYERALSAFFSFLPKLPVLLFEIPAHSEVYRTRTHENLQFFERIDEISIPNKQFIKSFARCNRPFQPIFYGSDTRITSYAELVDYWSIGKGIGDKIYVTTGKWKIKKPLNSIIVSSPDTEERIFKYDSSHGIGLDDFINSQDTETQEAVKLLYRFLFEWYRKPSKHNPLTYYITTAYSNLAFTEAYDKANCIQYPSVPFHGQGINLAIKDSFINENNMELEQVMCSEFTIYETPDNFRNFIQSNAWFAKEVNSELNTIKW